MSDIQNTVISKSNIDHKHETVAENRIKLDSILTQSSKVSAEVLEIGKTLSNVVFVLSDTSNQLLEIENQVKQHSHDDMYEKASNLTVTVTLLYKSTLLVFLSQRNSYYHLSLSFIIS